MQVITSNPSRCQKAAGFTLVELITIIILLGILAVVAIPRLNSTLEFRELAVRDQTVATLRFAQKTAVSHRRLVCVTIATDTVSLSIAKNYGDTSCSQPLTGPDGKQPAIKVGSSNTVLNVGPASPMLFLPSGSISSTATYPTPSNFSISVSNQAAIQIYGASGHVE